MDSRAPKFMTEHQVPSGNIGDPQMPLKRKRGRPRKHPLPLSGNPILGLHQPQKRSKLPPKVGGEPIVDVQPKRKRGRPRKNLLLPLNAEDITVHRESKGATVGTESNIRPRLLTKPQLMYPSQKPHPQLQTLLHSPKGKFPRLGTSDHQEYLKVQKKRPREDSEGTMTSHNKEGDFSSTTDVEISDFQNNPMMAEDNDAGSSRVAETRMIAASEVLIMENGEGRSSREPIDLTSDNTEELDVVDERYNSSSFDVLFADYERYKDQ